MVYWAEAVVSLLVKTKHPEHSASLSAVPPYSVCYVLFYIVCVCDFFFVLLQRNVLLYNNILN